MDVKDIGRIKNGVIELGKECKSCKGRNVRVANSFCQWERGQCGNITCMFLVISGPSQSLPLSFSHPLHTFLLDIYRKIK